MTSARRPHRRVPVPSWSARCSRRSSRSRSRRSRRSVRCDGSTRHVASRSTGPCSASECSRSSSCSARSRWPSRTARRPTAWPDGRGSPRPAGRARARVAAASALPAAAAAGVRFALEPGRGRNAVPVRSAILGAVLAIVVVVGTLTFGTSLHTLVSRPALYGWNWDYELSGGGGVGNIPQQLAATALDRDHDVAAWTDGYFGEVQIDGLAVPVLGGSAAAPVAPPLLSGHGIRPREPSRARRKHADATAQARRRHRVGEHGRREAGPAEDRRHRDHARDRRERRRAACTWRWEPAR